MPPTITSKPSSALNLRELVKSGRPVLVPGVLDPLSASLLESLGYECMCSGGLVATMELRVPESTISLLDTVSAAQRITAVTKVPLIVDGESGFGGVPQVQRMIREFERIGAAGTHIEDAVYPRPATGLAMISIEDMVAQLRAAIEVRDNPDFMIIARTEAYRTLDGDLDEVRRRLHAYAEAGVDALMPMVFDHEHAARIGQEFRQLPLVYLGRTLRDDKPELSISEISDMGYQIIIYAISSITVAAHTILSMHEQLLRTGKTGMDQQMVNEVWHTLHNLIEP